MKLLVQKVNRATAQVDGVVESRIGVGLLVTLGLRSGDTREEAQRLAAQVAKLNLWPEPEALDEDFGESGGGAKMFHSNTVDNGYEIMVVLQQSLCCTFPGLEPSEDEVMDPVSAQLIFEDFLKKLRADYQDEMVVGAPFGADVRLEVTSEGPCLFDLSTLGRRVSGMKANVKAGVVKKTASPVALELEPDVASVTRALKRVSSLPRSKRMLESCRVFRVVSLKKFRDALSNARQAAADSFAEALDAAGPYFTQKQQDQITEWTGIAIAARPLEDADEWVEEEAQGEEAADGAGELDLSLKLAELREEVTDPQKARIRKAKEAMVRQRAPMVKHEKEEEQPAFYEDNRGWGGHFAIQPKTTALTRPDWKGRAAPNTPAANAARAWAYSRGGQSWGSKSWTTPQKGLGKGKGKGKRRAYGIASLDESARIHGNSSEDFTPGQLARYSDQRFREFQAKEELGGVKTEAGYDEDETSGAKRKVSDEASQRLLKMPKGTPTVAPFTPANPTEDAFDEL
eukprot:TRINITY_DN18941_c2_g1_i1.p1 TRINITY_DN18941_c2_g1~~TRINITY_DN18941_c2_g1_i1.p1  ORF type:complete len:514 (-),score=140.99 TRINITY_DN18941_c2_g1_i1:201-1742(-)